MTQYKTSTALLWERAGHHHQLANKKASIGASGSENVDMLCIALYEVGAAIAERLEALVAEVEKGPTPPPA